MFTYSEKLNFIGVDQNGSGNPLPLARLHLVEGNWALECHPLKSFTRESLQTLNISLKDRPTLISVDCVFWSQFNQNLRNLRNDFKNAYAWRLKHGGLGRKIAEDFFKTHRRPPGSKRPIDLLAKAQSLYSVLPYQRNIQTGTFRIWSDLGESPLDWITLYPWANPKNPAKPLLVEAYPSHAWRSMFGVKMREPHLLPKMMRSLLPEKIKITAKNETLIKTNPNYADAAVLALHAFLNFRQLKILSPHERSTLLKNGYIFGVNPF